MVSWDFSWIVLVRPGGNKKPNQHNNHAYSAPLNEHHLFEVNSRGSKCGNYKVCFGVNDVMRVREIEPAGDQNPTYDER